MVERPMPAASAVPVHALPTVMPNEPTSNAGAVESLARTRSREWDAGGQPRFALPALDQAADAVLMLGPDGRFFYANAEAGRLLGYEPNVLLALAAQDIDASLPLARWHFVWKRLRRVRRKTYETRLRRSDGTMFPVEVAASFVELEGREYLCAFVRDITSRRVAEERLRESEERFRHLVEGSLQGISIDAYDNKPLFVNQAFAELYGYESITDILRLESLQLLVHPEDRARIDEYTRQRKLGNPSPSIYDFRGIRRDGKQITVLCSAKPVIWKDGVSAVQATLLDITDRQRLLDAERAQEAERRRLVGALETSSEAFALFDREDRLYYCNQRYRELMCSVQDVLKPGTTFTELAEVSVRRGAIPEAYGRENEWLAERLARHRLPVEPTEIYRADSGAWVTVREQRLDDGDTFVVVSDVTRIKESERELAEKTAQLQTAYENMDQGIVMLDEELRIIAFNQRYVELLALAEVKIEIGLPVERTYRVFAEQGGYGAGDVDELVDRRLNRLASGEPYRFVAERLDGRFLEVRGRPLPTGGHVITYTDITETHQLSRKLSYQASHDALTGLDNRSSFEGRLQKLLSTARQGATHALCYLDLDQFKVINDTCGHLAGDELLRQLGSLLPEQVRQQDILARLGGDEFGLLLENCDVKHAAAIAEKVRQAIESFRFMWGEKMFRVGTSVGVVPITEFSENVSALLTHADAACYAAKDQGGNRVHVYHAEDTELARQRGDMQWVSDINRALEHDAFVLFKQPILNLADGDDTQQRFEILLRLKNANGRLFEPKSFLRSAERFGLMIKVDRWVLAAMLDWLSSRGADDDPVNYFINISGISLRDAAFRDHVVERLADVDTAKNRICFEVTETAAVTSLSSAAAFIEKVRGLGHYCALDDFGSGLSSFAYLRNLPVNYLKIDGQFVRDIAHDAIDLAMVKSITEIAQLMDKKTIAEYAETDAVVMRLRELGVDFAQGFSVGYPRPLSEQVPVATPAPPAP